MRTTLSRLLDLMRRLFRRIFGIFTGKSLIRRICESVVLTSSGDPDAFTILAVEQALQQSRSLVKEVQRLKSGKLEGRELEAVVRRIADKKGFGDPGGERSADVMRKAVLAIARSYAVVESLNALAGTSYENEKHWALLVELYTLLRPTEPPPERYGDHWVTVGFQGKDPATDFRGMGVLALSDCVYFARHHGEEAAQVLEASNHESSWFPFAATGVNVTLFAIESARRGDLQRLFFTYGATVETYQEFYSYVYHRFLLAWESEQQTNQALTVLDFPRVFRSVREEVERELAAGGACVLDAVTVGLDKSGKEPELEGPTRQESEKTL